VPRGGGGGGGVGAGGGGGGGGYKPAEVKSTVSQLRQQLRKDGISTKDPTTIRRQRQEILDKLTSPPNAVDPRLAKIAYRRILKRAKAWDSNPNNPGSGAWRPGR